MNGSEVGIRTRRKISSSPRRVRAHQLDRTRVDATSGRAACSRSRGRSRARRRSPSSRTGSASPNQLFVIGAKAMIGIAFAAIANGISALPERRGSARARAPSGSRGDEPSTKPPSRLLERVDAVVPERRPCRPRTPARCRRASAAGTSGRRRASSSPCQSPIADEEHDDRRDPVAQPPADLAAESRGDRLDDRAHQSSSAAARCRGTSARRGRRRAARAPR